MDAKFRAWSDQYDAQIVEAVRKSGWFIQYVGGSLCSRPGCDCPQDDGPAFAYTIGLFGLGHPELLIFGVDPRTAGEVLNDLGERVRSGAALMPGLLVEFDDWPHRIVPECNAPPLP